MRRIYSILAGVVFLAGSALPAHAAVDSTWLQSQQNADGSFGLPSAASITKTVDTSEALALMGLLAESSTPSYTAGLAYLNSDPEANTESLSRKVLANLAVGGNVAPLVAGLLTHRNADGGFGDTAGYSSSVLDTAFALRALTAASAVPAAELTQTIIFLLDHQQADGGWTDGNNDSSVYLTSLAIQALGFYRNQYPQVKTAVGSGEQFLLSQRGADNLWGETFESALALIALTPGVVDLSLLDASFTALSNAQAVDGSWGGDVYSTALALQALFAYEARSSAGIAASAAISGYVLRAGSGEPIVGAEVQLTGSVTLSVQTNASGYYLIPGLAAGSYTVSASKTGYTAASASVTTVSGQTAVAGTLVLDVAPTVGLVRGKVFNGSDNTALDGVTISLVGMASYTTTTSLTGDFDFGSVATGDYTVSFSKTGFQSVSGLATVAGGQVLLIQQPMMADGAFLDTTPGTISGTVLDAKTGLPIAGATFDLGGGYSASTDTNGAFTVASVPRGNYNASLSANGYKTQAYSVNYPAGSSGVIGTLKLYPATADTVPSTITLLGSVTDSVSGAPIAGATVNLPGSGQSAVTGTDGSFSIAGIATTSFDVAVSATGYLGATYMVQANGFGEVHAGLPLTPDSAAATTTLSGIVSDLSTGTPIAGAAVSISGTIISTVTASDGSYSLAGIDTLDFTVAVSASGYTTESRALQIAAHGNYTFNPLLQVAVGVNFEVGAITPRQPSAASNSDILFDFTVRNLLGAAQDALVVAEVVNAAGQSIATVEPYAPGTTTPASSFSFTADETKALVVAWNTEQHAPGTYRIIVRVIEPGSITRAVPWGTVWAENNGYAGVDGVTSISGTLLLIPPLTQAGSTNPVALSARIRNSGNTDLVAGDYTLTISHPVSGATLFSTTATGVALAVGESVAQDFGSWVPTEVGNLDVVITPVTAGVGGQISGRLYVGDKATGTFTTDRDVVPEGTQTVRGNIRVEGVDTTQGSVTDPLYPLVVEAVRRGGIYTGRESIAWDRRNQNCMGCHIQTQSLMGMSLSLNKADISLDQTKYLYNTIVSSQQQNGGVYMSHPYHGKVQTGLGLWSLTSWADKTISFRAKYRAAKYMFDRRSRSGNKTWWTNDHNSGWWRSTASMTALTAKGYADLLESAATIDMSQVMNYSLGAGVGLGSGNDPRDITAGSDGMLYILVYNSGVGHGSVLRLDPSTGTVTTAVANTGSAAHGLKIAADGTMFAAGYQRLLRINTDGTQQVLRQNSSGQYYVGIDIGPDGLLYVSDYNNQRILRMGQDGSNQQVFASGSIFKRPYGLIVSDAGDVYVANYLGRNILKVTPAGVVSVFADGLAYNPLMMSFDARGGITFSTSHQGSTGLTTPYGIARVTQDGIAEPIMNGTTIWGMTNYNGTLWLADRTNKQARPLNTSPFNVAALDALRNELPNMVRAFLPYYRDNTGNNVVQAQRLNLFAEVRPYITDPVMQADIDTAIPYIAGILRARQRSDGGWGRYNGWGSDPLVTAMVGMAIDYTNPSADDPLVRKAITYLLNRQLSDGSWNNVNNSLTTRLAATSFVMAYLPLALDRLGGMDMDVHMTLPSNITLANPSLAPASITPLANGESDYLWSLTGVTSAGLDIGFDLTLVNMQLNESRPAASAAYLEFKNSFVNSTERLDLAIPSIRAASEMTVNVSTDKLSYGANEDVLIAPVVSNGGPTTASGDVYLTVRAAGSTTPLATLAPIPVTNLASGQQLTLSALWNTGTTLAGNFEVLAVLIDTQGRELSRAVSPFDITSPAIAVTTSVVTDKPLYGGWDTVLITGYVTNTTKNAILPASLVEIIVRDPSGVEVYRSNQPVSELAPGALRTVTFSMPLVDAPTGPYTVELQLLNAFSHALMSTSNTAFQVQWGVDQALTGTVTTDPQRVAWGLSDACTFNTTNRSATAVSGVTLIHRLINMDTGVVVSDVTRPGIDLAGGAGDTYVRTIDTSPLGVGGYACQLLAEINGTEHSLAFAGFQVYDPVKMDATLNTGSKGRVLVLLDPATGGGSNCADFKQVGMSTSFASLPANAVVNVSVLNTSLKEVERETIALADMTGPVNLAPGAEGADLTIASFSDTGLSLLLSEYHASNGSIPNKHTVTADITVNGAVVMSLTSDLIQSSCGKRPAIGDISGNFTVDKMMFASAAAADPFGPELAPDLVSQRAYVEALLTQAGWAYTIVESAEDFRVRLNSGEYSIYLLLNEYEKLDETTQKALREAVFRGDGLIVAGGHDARNAHHPKLTEAMGLQPQGVFPDSTGADSLLAPAIDPTLWPAGGTGFTVLQKVGRSALNGAMAIVEYRRPATAAPAELGAVMHHDFGAGRTVTMGFDWAAEATAQALYDNYLGQLLIRGLDHVSPADPDTTAGKVVPLTLGIQNLGITAPTRVTIDLPAGTSLADAGTAKVKGSSLVWDFTLLEGQAVNLDFWVKLPELAGPLTFNSEVSAVNPSGKYHVYATPSLAIDVVDPMALDSVQLSIDQLLAAGVGEPNALNRAQNALGRAQAALAAADPSTALFEGLKAADALQVAGPSMEVAIVRMMLDHWLWSVARLVP